VLGGKAHCRPLRLFHTGNYNDRSVPSADCHGAELERLVPVVQRPLASRMPLRQQSASFGWSQTSSNYEFQH
jgi:hypothetical protein